MQIDCTVGSIADETIEFTESVQVSVLESRRFIVDIRRRWFSSRPFCSCGSACRSEREIVNTTIEIENEVISSSVSRLLLVPD